MPKPIKKKTIKPKASAGSESDVRSMLAHVGEFADEHKRQVNLFLGVFALTVVLTIGVYVYTGNMKSKIGGLMFEGYKQYYGLYEAEPLMPAQRMNSALESFQQANEIKQTPETMFYIASAYHALGRLEDARSILNEMLKAYPLDDTYTPLAMYKMAVVDMELKDNDAALKALDRLHAYRTSSFKDLALVEAARILEAQGKEEEAIRKYKAIAEGYPESPFIEEAKFKAKAGEGEEAEGGGGKDG